MRFLASSVMLIAVVSHIVVRLYFVLIEPKESFPLRLFPQLLDGWQWMAQKCSSSKIIRFSGTLLTTYLECIHCFSNCAAFCVCFTKYLTNFDLCYTPSGIIYQPLITELSIYILKRFEKAPVQWLAPVAGMRWYAQEVNDCQGKELDCQMMLELVFGNAATNWQITHCLCTLILPETWLSQLVLHLEALPSFSWKDNCGRHVVSTGDKAAEDSNKLSSISRCYFANCSFASARSNFQYFVWYRWQAALVDFENAARRKFVNLSIWTLWKPTILPTLVFWSVPNETLKPALYTSDRIHVSKSWMSKPRFEKRPTRTLVSQAFRRFCRQ